MDRTLQGQLLKEGHGKRAPLARGIAWGFLGGLSGTLAMDILLMGILVAAGYPAFTCFSIVGDTVASLFSPDLAGTTAGILLGVAAHYLIGPLMGVMFGAGAAKFGSTPKAAFFRLDSLKKTVLLAVLYAEVLSIPMLAMPPILLQMTASEMLQWFGGACVMHMVWGCVMGFVWSRGLQKPAPENRK